MGKRDFGVRVGVCGCEFGCYRGWDEAVVCEAVWGRECGGEVEDGAYDLVGTIGKSVSHVVTARDKSSR